MQNNTRNTVIGIVLCVVVLLVWQPIVNYFWPPPPPAPKLLRDTSTLVTGSVTGMGLMGEGQRVYIDRRTKAVAVAEAGKKEKEKKDPIVAAPILPKDLDIQLIPLGLDGPSHLRVVLNS